MLLQTQIPAEDVVGVTTSYGTNGSSDSDGGLLDRLFPFFDHPVAAAALIGGALVALVIVRSRRTPQEP